MSLFSSEKLLDCLQDPKLFPGKYKEFKQSYAQHKQHIIHPSLCLLKTKLQSQKGHPMNKMHTLRAIKQAVDTGSFGVLQFVQAQILSILQLVAEYEAGNSDPDRGKTLFLNELKQPTLKSEYQKIGNSYLRYVLECVEVWATIKPYFVSQFKEIKSIQSGFAILYDNLKSKNVSFLEKKSYYKVEDLGKFRDKFLESLNKMAEKPEEYTDFYSSKLTKALENEQIYKNSETSTIINMILLPDYLLERNALDLIKNNLSSSSSSHASKIISLKLLCQLFNYGSINILDYTQSHILSPLIKIIKQFNILYNLKSLNSKESRERESAGMSKIEEKLYHQILKSIILLGESCPKDPFTKEETLLKKTVNQLNNNGYQLPVVIELADFKSNYEANIEHIHEINSLVKRTKASPSVIASIYQFISTSNTNNNAAPDVKIKNSKPSSNVNSQSKRLPIPRFDVHQDIHQTINTIKSIYRQLKRLNPSNQSEDKRYLNQCLDYINTYNNNIDAILEQNIQLNDFDAITNEAYELLQKNINISEEFENNVPYHKKLFAVKNLIEEQQTPNSPINLVSNVSLGEKDKRKEINKSIELPEGYNFKPTMQLNIPELKLPNQHKSNNNINFKDNNKVEEVSYQNKSVSSYDNKLYQLQKQKQIEIIAEYQKQHFHSRRKKQQQISYKPKSSNILNNSSEKSIIHNILDNDIHSQASIPLKPNKLNESLISNKSKVKNKIGVRRIDDSESFSDSMSMKSMDYKLKEEIAGGKVLEESRKIGKGIVKSEYQGEDKKKDDFHFIQDKMIESKSIAGVNSLMKRDSNPKIQTAVAAQPQGMIASFGDPAFIPGIKNRSNNYIQEQHQQSDFKKKKDMNDSVIIKKQVILHQPLHHAPPFLHQSKQDSMKSSLLKQSIKSIPLKSSNFIPPRKNNPYTEQNSQIIEPGFQPMNNSFYQPQNQIKEQFQKVNNSQVPRFNDCFQAEKFLIPSKTFGNESKKYWLEQDAKLLTTFNFNKSNNEKSLKSELYNTNISIPEIISQHNKYFQLEIEGIKNQHKKQIQFLENKVRKLEKSKKDQQKQLSEQKQQIESLRITNGAGGSQINYLGKTFKSNQEQFLQLQNIILKNKLQNQTRSHYQSKNMSPIKSISDQFTYSRDKFSQQVPKGTIFPSQPYQQYIANLDNMGIKKQMFKNKDLLVKNENLEIGFIVSKEGNCLRVALFVQSESKELVDVRVGIKSKGLVLETHPEVFPSEIKLGKQERYIVGMFVTNSIRLPYQTPEIQMSYRIRNKVQSFSLQFPIPLTFNRLLEYSQISPLKFKQIQQMNESYIARGEQIPYNKKILKDVSSIKQILPKLQMINPEMEAEYLDGNEVLKFGVRAVYEPLNMEFLVKINVKPGNYLYIQTIPTGRPSSNRIPEELLICTMNHLLRRERHW